MAPTTDAVNSSVRMFPRRKGVERGGVPAPQRGRQPVALDLAAVQAKFQLPQRDAARNLGISLTSLKQVCRKLGLRRWPYHRPKNTRGIQAKKGHSQYESSLAAHTRKNDSEVQPSTPDACGELSSNCSSGTLCHVSLPAIQGLNLHEIDCLAPKDCGLLGQSQSERCMLAGPDQRLLLAALSTEIQGRIGTPMPLPPLSYILRLGTGAPVVGTRASCFH